MDAAAGFSRTYAEARGRFLDAARAAGAAVESIAHPLSGPDGGGLATDVARFGPADAQALLFVSSGTHGIEGFCGSGCQVGLLAARLQDELPPGTALLLVHALNPHGFAHERRVTEDNVDLNRNFVDHAAPPPANPGYAELHPLLLPADWDGPARAAAEAGIARWVEANGRAAFQAAVSGGQYTHPDGLFYGGRRPTWSNGTLRGLVERHAAGRARVAYIDLHTGLGPRGYGEPIFIGRPDSPEHARALAWYGPEVTCPDAGTSTSARVVGTVVEPFAALPAGTAFTGIAIEYGTLPLADVLEGLRGDHWLHLHAEAPAPLRRELKAKMRAVFYVEADDWKRQVFERCHGLARKALAGLAE